MDRQVDALEDLALRCAVRPTPDLNVQVADNPLGHRASWGLRRHDGHRRLRSLLGMGGELVSNAGARRARRCAGRSGIRAASIRSDADTSPSDGTSACEHIAHRDTSSPTRATTRTPSVTGPSVADSAARSASRRQEMFAHSGPPACRRSLSSASTAAWASLGSWGLPSARRHRRRTRAPRAPRLFLGICVSADRTFARRRNRPVALA